MIADYYFLIVIIQLNWIVIHFLTYKQKLIVLVICKLIVRMINCIIFFQFYYKKCFLCYSQLQFNLCVAAALLLPIKLVGTVV